MALTPRCECQHSRRAPQAEQHASAAEALRALVTRALRGSTFRRFWLVEITLRLDRLGAMEEPATCRPAEPGIIVDLGGDSRSLTPVKARHLAASAPTQLAPERAAIPVGSSPATPE